MNSRLCIAFFLLTGSTVAQIDVGNIDMNSGGPAEFNVKVTRPNDPVRNHGVLVSAYDLAAPTRARKELHKATELMGKQELAQAIQRLNKAIAIYPTYGAAYNDLGVIYSRLGDSVREREALQTAISLDDHFALAYVNLGRMDITQGDFPSAESALDKASATDPGDPIALILLSYAEFMQGRFDQTVATSRKAHAIDKPHAFVHRVAARAFERQGQGEKAVAELKMFLKEEPSGPRADAARKELETVKAVLQ